VSRSSPEIPTDPVFRQQFGRPRGVLLAPAAFLVALGLWVGAVQLGESQPGNPAPASSAPDSTDVAAASASPPPRRTLRPAPEPTQAPILQLFGPPLAGQVLIRDWGVRRVDLATGNVSSRIGSAGYLNRVLALPGGQVVCVCVRETTVGEERIAELRLITFDEAGARPSEAPLGRWIGADQPGLHGDSGPFAMDAAHSPDGRLVAVTTSVRRPPEWQRQVLLVDVADGRVVSSTDLPSTPSAEGPAASPPSRSPDPSAPRWAWAASTRFSPDGRHVVVSALEVDSDGNPERRRTWIGAVEIDGLGDLREIAEGSIGGEPCRDALPEFGTADLILAVCWGDSLIGPFVRRIGMDGQHLPAVSLRAALKDAAAPSHVADGVGSLWLWDPWTWRAVRVDLVEGSADARSVGRSGVPARPRGPALALSPDGSRLIVAAAGAEDEGVSATRILVLDAATLETISEWNVGPDVISLALSDDGTLLFAAHLPRRDEAGNATSDAQLSVHEVRDGSLRAIFGRLGDQGFTLPRGSDPDT